MADVSLSFAGECFQPLPCGALFWPAQSLLLVADLHFEKGSHFARRGWLLPPHDSLDTLQRLAAAVARTGCRRVAALGDSFHDTGGVGRMQPAARSLLQALIGATDWAWITGNHDAASAGELGGAVVHEIALQGIMLRHEAELRQAAPEISGHYHPKVSLALRTGRRVSRRCIALAPGRMVLPAYGAYAGGLSVDDPAFAVALGARPDAIVALAGGLLRLSAHQREVVA
jgi:DNA ligase-associated metallophosphoesterase